MASTRHDLAHFVCALTTLSTLAGCALSFEVGERPASADAAVGRAVAADGSVADPPARLDAAAPVDAASPASCAPEDVAEELCPTAVCDGLDTWHWNGDSCFRIPCGTCVGTGCASGAPPTFTQADCEAAHSGCPPARCRASGGAWLWWAEECHDYLCGHAQPAECLVGHAVCDCGPGRRFAPTSGCVDEPTCPPPLPPDREMLCASTGGTWDDICCDTVCGERCPDPCVSPACDCGGGRVFDAARGCIESDRCHDRTIGETCEGTARCTDGTICCQACGGAGCFGPHRCTAPVCDSNPLTDECGNDLSAP